MIKCALPLLIISTCIVGIFADEQRILDSEKRAPICHSRDAEIKELNMQIANFQNKLVVYEERERKSLEEVKLYKDLNVKLADMQNKLIVYEERERKSLEEENKYNELNDKFNEINKKLAVYEYRERKSLEEGNKCNALNEKLDKQLRILLNLEERKKKDIEEINLNKQLNVQLGEVQKKHADCEERENKSKEVYSKTESSFKESLEQYRKKLSNLESNNLALNISNQKLKRDLGKFNNYPKYNNSCLKQRPGSERIGFVEIEGMADFEVGCANDLDSGPGWIVIQKRKDKFSHEFSRNTWSKYRDGFGNMNAYHINGHFFIGLEKLYRLTNAEPHELYIDMEDWDGNKKFAHYDNFRVGSEWEQYPLKDLGNYTGNAGDALRDNNNMKFSTIDQDNDNSPDIDCAEEYFSGWWHNNCTKANLNGRQYGSNLNGWQYGKYKNDEKGLWWLSPEVPLKNVRMLIRPKVKK